MKDSPRKKYFAFWWPAACEKQGWDAKNRDQRAAVTRECMKQISGPDTDSISDFGDAETTAIKLYLAHLADPDNINIVIEWERCKADYIAFNLAKQADHYQRKTYGSLDGNQLTKQRFHGRASAAGDVIDKPLSRGQAQRRLYTMRSRFFRPRKKKPEPQLVESNDDPF